MQTGETTAALLDLDIDLDLEIDESIEVAPIEAGLNPNHNEIVIAG